LYFGSLLASRNEVYGASKADDKFTKHLTDTTKNTIANSFNKSNWSFKEGDGATFSVKSLRAARLLNLGKDDASVKSLLKLMVTEGERAFVLSSTAKYG
jgi:hypothetical protein